MKKCSQCGRAYSDLIHTCPNCHAPLNGGAAPKPPVQPPHKPPVGPTPAPVQSGTRTAPATAREDVLMGILGALLFALGGGVIQVILIYVDVVASLAGLITFVLAYYGYEKCSGDRYGTSKKAVWICIPISLLMLLLGTFVGGTMLVAKVGGVTVSEAFRLIFANGELMQSIGKVFGKTVAFWGISVVISLIRGGIKK